MDEFWGRDRDDQDYMVREMKETLVEDVEVLRFKIKAFPVWMTSSRGIKRGGSSTTE
jgi:hypothetical protein